MQNSAGQVAAQLAPQRNLRSGTHKHVDELVDPLFNFDLQLLHEQTSWVHLSQEICSECQKVHKQTGTFGARGRNRQALAACGLTLF